MTSTTTERSYRVAFFKTLVEADHAVKALLAAGFSKNDLAIICPKPFDQEFAADVPRAEHPGSHATEAIVEGGAVGAALGGIGLGVVAAATGGVGLLPAIPLLIGGGALAGAFSGLILQDGYGNDIGEYYEEAIRLGRIVVGVNVEGEGSTRRLMEAEEILVSTGGTSPAMMDEVP